MGGRIATQVAAADPDAAARRSRAARVSAASARQARPSAATSICRRSRRPMLFVQGSRDAFGTPAELAPIVGQRCSRRRRCTSSRSGDHSFKLSRKDPAAQAAVYADVQRAIVSSACGRSRLQLHDVAAAREAVTQVERDAARRRPQHDAIDAVRLAPTSSAASSSSRADAAALRRLDVEIRQVRVAARVRRSDWGSSCSDVQPDLTDDARRRCTATHARHASPSPARGASTPRSASTNASCVSPAAAGPRETPTAAPPALRASADDGAVGSRSSRLLAREETWRPRCTTSSDHSWPPSNVERRAPSTPASRRRRDVVRRTSSVVYHSSRAPRQTSADAHASERRRRRSPAARRRRPR